jgi:hypothetical protein
MSVNRGDHCLHPMGELAWLTARPGSSADAPGRRPGGGGASGGEALRPRAAVARPASSGAPARAAAAAGSSGDGGGGGSSGSGSGSGSSNNGSGDSPRGRVRPRSAVGADTIGRLFAVQHEKKLIEHECRVRCLVVVQF